MSLIKYSPFANLDRFFEDESLVHFRKYGWDLAVDVFEEKDTVIAKMGLPGINPDELKITIDGDLLSISGDRQEEHEVDEKEYYSKEIRRGSFSRVVELPAFVDEDHTEAVYKDGMLKITMPKLPEEEKKSVEIKVKK